MASFTNNALQGRRLGRYAVGLVVVAVLLVAAGAGVTAMLWSGTWLVVTMLATADLMLLLVAFWFVRVAIRVRRRGALEIRQIDLDAERMTVHYATMSETLDLRDCRFERGSGGQDGWDFRVCGPRHGVQVRTAGFSDAEALRALLSACVEASTNRRRSSSSSSSS